jgi:hypothetical protein
LKKGEVEEEIVEEINAPEGTLPTEEEVLEDITQEYKVWNTFLSFMTKKEEVIEISETVKPSSFKLKPEKKKDKSANKEAEEQTVSHVY